MTSPNPNFYTVGGPVQAGSGVYVPRKADSELLALCQEGTFAYVLTARQMGKSSLMVRTAKRLAEDGVVTAIVDLQGSGKLVSVEQWYLNFLVSLEEALEEQDVELETNVRRWWRANGDLGPSKRFSLFVEKVLLAEVSAPIVIFVDEIDTTLGLDFTDDFFVAIRYFYTSRATKPVFQRLSFVLIGVATPGDLIRDPQRTPFNVGRRV
ncbi:MAG: AAA-like domain-containing protein, partial [Cyanobacteria bacterium J06648_11]